jgi:hypothetical protein
MMEYFKPLMTWLEEQNKGRQIGWEYFRHPSSEVRGQPSFRAKRFWSAMRPRIALKTNRTDPGGPSRLPKT